MGASVAVLPRLILGPLHRLELQRDGFLALIAERERLGFLIVLKIHLDRDHLEGASLRRGQPRDDERDTNQQLRERTLNTHHIPHARKKSRSQNRAAPGPATQTPQKTTVTTIVSL